MVDLKDKDKNQWEFNQDLRDKKNVKNLFNQDLRYEKRYKCLGYSRLFIYKRKSNYILVNALKIK